MLKSLGLALYLMMAQQPPAANDPPKFPYREALVYRVGWRMITAGNATLRLIPSPADGWLLNMDLASAGFVNQLYHVSDSYRLATTASFAARA